MGSAKPTHPLAPGSEGVRKRACKKNKTALSRARDDKAALSFVRRAATSAFPACGAVAA